ncbi:MAG: sigma-70 family RNA polymerase sigma factor [Deltaproteobacteria bacterium]|nr:sigma-70 family RNA polymerase sigma factor [Deltaproteobacteria bacterium]
MRIGENRKLASALNAGDRKAADALVESTYRQVYGSLFRLCGGDRELTADLTQETYRRAWSGLAGFQGKAKISTWLYRIAYTTFLNHVRRPRPLTPLEDDFVENLETPEPGQDEILDQHLEARRLRRAVMDLPEVLRFTVSSRFWGELPVREIARLEGVTVVAIRKRLKKAMRLLEMALEEEV